MSVHKGVKALLAEAIPVMQTEDGREPSP